MKTTSTKIATVGATLGIVVALLAMSGALTPVFAATQASAATATTTTASTSVVPPLAVGQTITITSTSGHFKVVGGDQSGPAAGTMTLTVTGRFVGGYSLSITAGSLNLNGTTFGISSGSAETGPYDHHMVGQGVTASATPVATAPGSFLFRATARGTFGGEYATMSLDLQTGTTEYVIALVGTIQS